MNQLSTIKKQRSKWLKAPLSGLYVLLFTIPLLVIGASEALAYQTTGNCANCHGGFLDNPYISLSDGANWGDSLHNVHRNDMLNSDCDVCHASGSRSPVYLDSSKGGSGLDTISCVGCHGRDEDMGSDSESLGRGAGLRQHHTNAGVSSCSGCHSDADPANYTPVGEDVLPNYYANPGSNHPLIPEDPCNPGGSEGSFAGTLLGLDNDGNGIYDTADDACSVNTPPVADAGGPYNGTVGSPVSFDGSASSDTDGSIVSYAWDFGDGSSGSGVSPSHSYASDGSFTVRLTVTDNSGGTGSASSSASIAPPANIPPVADAGGPYSGTVGSPVSFDGSASSDTDGSIVSYAWDFGDGNSGSGVSPSHSYASDGSFTVSLTVTDNSGATDTAGSTAAIVTDSLPPSMVTIRDARWDRRSKLRIRGFNAVNGFDEGKDLRTSKASRAFKRIKARGEEAMVITNADTGELIGTARVSRGGAWKLDIKLEIAPCRVRATFNGQFDEKDVKDAPANCNGGTGQSTGTYVTGETDLESEEVDSKLEVKTVNSHRQAREKQ
jgi:PKD repeat protein